MDSAGPPVGADQHLRLLRRPCVGDGWISGWMVDLGADTARAGLEGLVPRQAPTRRGDLGVRVRASRGFPTGQWRGHGTHRQPSRTWYAVMVMVAGDVEDLPCSGGVRSS